MVEVETPIRQLTDTTNYRTPESVNVECDYLEDQGANGVILDQVNVTRLELDLYYGRGADLTAIAELRKKLGLPSSKRVTVVQTSAGRRQYRRNATEAAILTEPLGPYFKKLSVPQSILNAPEVSDAWDKNPILTVEVSMIPANVDPGMFASNRFRRANNVSLHFESGSLANVFTLLMAVECWACVLELRNVVATPAELKVLLFRLQNAKWKYLKSITIATRRT